MDKQWQVHCDDLESALLKAHENPEPEQLAGLYTCAADRAQSYGDVSAACFYLTQAMVYALEAGLDDSDILRSRLAALGRI